MTSFSLLAMFFLIQPRMLLAFFAATAHCWVIFNFLSTKTPNSFSAFLVPSRYWYLGLFFPKCRTLYFPVFNYSCCLMMPSSYSGNIYLSGLQGDYLPNLNTFMNSLHFIRPIWGSRVLSQCVYPETYQSDRLFTFFHLHRGFMW